MPFIHLNREKGAAARRLYHKSLEIATDAEKYMPFIHLNHEKGAAARRLYHKSLEIATDAEKYMPFIYLNREKGGGGSPLISQKLRNSNKKAADLSTALMLLYSFMIII